ncbi:MAG: hypothetical protein QXT43_01385 [Candidatus Micrarchaeaceae archaeon]
MIIPILIASMFIAASAVAGLAFSRHLITLMLAIELILVSATVLLVYFFAASEAGSVGVLLLFAIWSIAAAEAIVALAFYAFMRQRGIDFDLSKLNRMKW